jgi:tetratricopeptide (TPR) repeat protein
VVYKGQELRLSDISYDAAFFLGSSLYEQGHYRESAQAYQRCLEIRPDDPTVLNNSALSLEGLGDYAGAEPLYRRALAIRERRSDLTTRTRQRA